MRCFVISLFTVLIANTVLGEVVVNVGDLQLAPNTPNQKRDIFVSGDGDQVFGVDFYARIGDGITVPGGPRLTAVDVIGASGYQPTMFTGNNTGQGGEIRSYYVVATTTTNHDTVSATGRLATLTFDTTGVTSGSWALSLMTPTPDNTPMDFVDVFPTINNGTVSITPVPEPSTIAALVSGGICMIGLVWTRRRPRDANG